MGEIVLNITDYVDKRITSLVGRDSGKELLTKIHSSMHKSLEQIETEHSSITVKISDKYLTMNRSYFLGAFAERVISLGSEDAFKKKYHFDAPDYILEKIEDSIQYALKKSSQKEILDV